MSIRRWSPFFLIFFVVCVFATPSFSFADTASDIQAQIEANNKQLESLKAEIAEYQEQLNALVSKKDTLQSAVNSLTLSQKQLATQISVTQNKIAGANLEIKKLTLSIGDKESTIAVHQDVIAKALSHIAESDGASFITQLMSVNSFSDVWVAVDQRVLFNRALGDNIADLRAVRTELATNRDKVAKVKANLVSLQNDLSLQKKSIDLQKTAQQKLLSDTKNRESSYQKIVANKKAEEAAFEAALFELESKLQYVLDPNRIPPSGKGVLRWPLKDVYVTQQFGKTSSSARLYVSGTHNGADFRAAIGTPVLAALSGTVLAINHGSVPYCQYGKWVLIKHSNGLTTLYAHLSDISVQKGDAVSTGKVIGFSGDTGYAVGPHLHFGVYISDAVSFKQFTCWNKSVVNIPVAPTNAYLDPLSYL